MDINCPRCGEPWDMDSLHDAYDEDMKKMTFDQARQAFYTDGCQIFGSTCTHNPGSQKAAAAQAMYELLGDDIDGADAMLEDFEYMGMI